MGIRVYSLSWVMPDLYHQQYDGEPETKVCRAQPEEELGFRGFRALGFGI